MIERFRKILRQVDPKASRPQREALIDLLIWMMYADHVLALPEREMIDEMAETLNSDETLPLSQYLGASVGKVRRALGDDEKSEALLDDIYQRLGTDDMRHRAYEACRRLAEVDGLMAEPETAFLDRLDHRFGPA